MLLWARMESPPASLASPLRRGARGARPTRMRGERGGCGGEGARLSESTGLSAHLHLAKASRSTCVEC